MLRLVYVRYMRNHISLLTEIRNNIYTTYTLARSVISKKLSTSAIMSNNIDLAKCFEFAKELTLQAGEIIKCNFEAEKDVRAKGRWDFVTKFDQEIEKMFIDALSKEFPDHKIVAEEMTAMNEIPELMHAPTWFLDPIDGTVNFIHSFPNACISVGLMVCKEVVLGIIYNPMHSELYSAIKGEGAFLNGQPICTSKITELKKALQAYEPSYINVIKDKDIEFGRMNALLEATKGTRNIGSLALTLAYIARGALDCGTAYCVKPWDVVAGIVILREAGGSILDSKGKTYDVMQPNVIAASNETLAREISKLFIDTDLKTQRKRLKRT